MDLGVMVSIYDGTDFDKAFGEAREAGFSHGQVTVFVPGITAEEVREIAVAARSAAFHVDAVGCYMNPLRPNGSRDALMEEPSLLDWRTLVENMAMLNGVERIVCWSGTLGRTLGTPNLMNQEESTFNNLYITLAGLREQVRGLPVEIILEPYTAHVLHDAASCCRMAAKFPGGDVKVVLDAPNMISVKEFAHRNENIEAYVKQVAPAVGLVHLKDINRDADGHRQFLPPGKGALDYGRYLAAIAQYIPEVPVVLENVRSVEEMRAAREFVERTARDQGI